MTNAVLSLAKSPRMLHDAPHLQFDYINHRGEAGARRVVPIAIRFGVSDWHTDPQWLMEALDLDKGAPREFAMRDMSNVSELSAD